MECQLAVLIKKLCECGRQLRHAPWGLGSFELPLKLHHKLLALHSLSLQLMQLAQLRQHARHVLHGHRLLVCDAPQLLDLGIPLCQLVLENRLLSRRQVATGRSCRLGRQSGMQLLNVLFLLNAGLSLLLQRGERLISQACSQGERLSAVQFSSTVAGLKQVGGAVTCSAAPRTGWLLCCPPAGLASAAWRGLVGQARSRELQLGCNFMGRSVVNHCCH